MGQAPILHRSIWCDILEHKLKDWKIMLSEKPNNPGISNRHPTWSTTVTILFYLSPAKFQLWTPHNTKDANKLKKNPETPKNTKSNKNLENTTHNKRLKNLKSRHGGETQQPSNKLVYCNNNSQTVLQIYPVEKVSELFWKQGTQY